MGVLCLIYMICALRTNLVFVGIFLFLVPAFGCLAGAYWHLAQGNVSTALTLLKAGGACCFVVCALGWWIFFAILLASLDFPFQLPGKSTPVRLRPAIECLLITHLQSAIYRLSSRVRARRRRNARHASTETEPSK